MRFITAILLLASAVSSYAQTTVDYTIRALVVETSDNRNYVQEYDGRHHGGLEADVEISAVGRNTYADFGGYDLNGPNASEYFNMNFGPGISAKGKFLKLTHRVPVPKTGVIMNGRFVSPLDNNRDLVNYLVPVATDTTGLARVSFDRTEAEAKFVFQVPSAPDAKLTFGVWQEDEIGQAPARWSQNIDQAVVVDLNRQTRDVSLGILSGIGDGAFSAEYTHRNFSDSASQTVSSISVQGYLLKVDKPESPSHVMNLYDLRFRNSAGAALPIAGSLSARTRTSGHNKYTSSAYSATAGTSYKPAKNVYLSAKAYGRVVGIYENQGFRDDLGKVWGTAGGPAPQIDHSNLAGDLKARYEFSDKLSFKAGYKYENNYRRNADDYEEVFTKTASYQDGTYISSNTQSQGVAVQDTKHTMTAGLDAMLPLDIELGAEYRKMVANHAVFESMPTVQDQIDFSLNVPLPAKLTLMTSGVYLSEKNKKSSLTDASMYQNSYHAGLEWAGNSWITAGVDYAYEQASYRNTGWFGAADNPTGVVIIVNQLRVPGMLYRYENNIYGYHATAKMSKEFSLTGQGSYTVSRGAIPVNLYTWRGAGTNIVVTNFGPMDLRIASGGFTLKYTPMAYQDVTARLSFRRDQYLDKVVVANSGAANTASLALSAKF